MANEHLHQDLEHRVVRLERYVADQTIRSANFGKRFADLESAVAAIQQTLSAVAKKTSLMGDPQHQYTHGNR